MTALATAAARELAAREQYWPREVEAGRADRTQAQADIDAWRAIAALFADGSVETQLSWADLLAALQFAEGRRIDAVIAARDSDKEAAMETRLGTIVALRRRVERSAWRAGHCIPEPAQPERIAA